MKELHRKIFDRIIRMEMKGIDGYSGMEWWTEIGLR